MSDAQYREGGGDTLPPYQEDYFQRIVNVHWAALEKFTIGAGGGDFGRVPTNNFWAQFAGASSNGVEPWPNVDPHINAGNLYSPYGLEKTWFDCTIRGKTQAGKNLIMALGGKSLPAQGDPESIPFWTNAPIAYVSRDGGKTWEDTKLPTKGPSVYDNVNFWYTNNWDVHGDAVGYNDKLKTFYASFLIFHSEPSFNEWVMQHWSYQGGWALTSETHSVSSIDFITVPYPSKTKVVGYGSRFLPGSNHIPASSGCPGVYMTGTDSKGKQRKVGLGFTNNGVNIDGSEVPVPQMGLTQSVALGKNGHIVVGGYDTDSNQNAICMSSDWGQSWKEILTQLKQGDQGFGPVVTFS